MRGIIICGFAGIGKSTLAKQGIIVDLESTPFKADWQKYIDVAIHMAKNGYNVALSFHEDVRKELHDRNVKFYSVLPTLDCKSEYIRRYIDRGNTYEFIEMFKSNWGDFVTTYDWENEVRLREGEYLKDVFDYLVKENV